MIKHLVKARQVSSFKVVSVCLLSVVSAGDCVASKTVYFVAMYPVHRSIRVSSVGIANVLRAGRSRVRSQVKARYWIKHQHMHFLLNTILV